ncbi:MAG: sigma-54 interaction domain-containing protein [Myxococcota bacterium]
MTAVSPKTSGDSFRFVGARMRELHRQCERIAKSEATVLITGETGTGKEVIARTLHELRGRGDFVAVNCGAIPEALLESELFGHVRGAFTGAATARKGRVALAHNGTLFLDEIGELSLPLHVKLLRLLQERTYEPVGSSETLSSNFRLLAATHKDLEEEVRAGRFRQDLYFRLFVCPLKVPALRERADDIAALFQHFWRQLGEDRPVEEPVLRALERYAWPGNVRELENLVERVSVCADGETITLEDLPERYLAAPEPVEAPAPEVPSLLAEEMPEGLVPPHCQVEPRLAALLQGVAIDLPQMLTDLEELFVQQALDQTGGNRQAAADLLGLRRTTLVEKLRRRAAREKEATRGYADASPPASAKLAKVEAA